MPDSRQMLRCKFMIQLHCQKLLMTQQKVPRIDHLCNEEIKGLALLYTAVNQSWISG